MFIVFLDMPEGFLGYVGVVRAAKAPVAGDEDVRGILYRAVHHEHVFPGAVVQLDMVHNPLGFREQRADGIQAGFGFLQFGSGHQVHGFHDLLGVGYAPNPPLD
jgi:hypothetical protein